MNSKLLSYGVVMLLHTGLLSATVKDITSVEEYKRVRNGQKPAVIVFNSPSCDACTRMEPFIKAASDNPDYQDADFYSVNTQNDALKELVKTEKIPAFPTTLFVKPGEKPRLERGGMSEQEINDITYYFIHGKKRAQPRPQKAAPQSSTKA